MTSDRNKLNRSRTKRNPARRLAQGLEPLAVRRKDAARLLGVSEATLRNWEAQQRGPAFLRASGRAILYNVATLRSWIASHSVDPEAA